MENASTLVTRRPDRSFTITDRVARNLGWFSIGLGLAELIAPGRMAKALGLEGKENLLRGYGVREITSGMWALTDTPTPAIWSRVGGDLLDIGTLAAGIRDGDEEQRRNAGIAIAAVVGITLIDLATAASLTRERSEKRGEVGRDYSDRSGFPKGLEAARSESIKGTETASIMPPSPVEQEPARQLESAS